VGSDSHWTARLSTANNRKLL
jgi:hypothetical protein